MGDTQDLSHMAIWQDLSYMMSIQNLCHTTSAQDLYYMTPTQDLYYILPTQDLSHITVDQGLTDIEDKDLFDIEYGRNLSCMDMDEPHDFSYMNEFGDLNFMGERCPV